MSGPVPHRDWMTFTRDLGAVEFDTNQNVEWAFREDGSLVGAWDHVDHHGWVRSGPGLTTDVGTYVR